jgi:hypothetical protein
MAIARPAAAKGIVARNVGGEVVLVPTQVGVASFENVYLLSQVGAFLWEHLDGTRDREQLCRLITSKFAIPDGRNVGNDVDTFLGELARRGLVVDSAS